MLGVACFNFGEEIRVWSCIPILFGNGVYRYTVCKICNHMYLKFHGFKMIEASSSPWFTGHPPLRGASWKSWAMPWDHRSYNPRRSRSMLDVEGLDLWHFSKELLIACASVCKRAKRRGPDPMEYLIAFFSFFSLSLSLSLVCSTCVCARVRWL